MVVDPPGRGGGLRSWHRRWPRAAYLTLLGTSYREGSLECCLPNFPGGTAPLLVGLGWLAAAGRDDRRSFTVRSAWWCSSSALLALAGLGNTASRRDVPWCWPRSPACARWAYSLIDAQLLSIVTGAHRIPVRDNGPELGTMVLDGDVVPAWTGFDSGPCWGFQRWSESARAAPTPSMLLAFQQAQAGQVAGLRQVSVVLGVLIAREALGPRALWGAVLVAAGAGSGGLVTTVGPAGSMVSRKTWQQS